MSSKVRWKIKGIHLKNCIWYCGIETECKVEARPLLPTFRQREPLSAHSSIHQVKSNLSWVQERSRLLRLVGLIFFLSLSFFFLYFLIFISFSRPFFSPSRDSLLFSREVEPSFQRRGKKKQSEVRGWHLPFSCPALGVFGSGITSANRFEAQDRRENRFRASWGLRGQTKWDLPFLGGQHRISGSLAIVDCQRKFCFGGGIFKLGGEIWGWGH